LNEEKEREEKVAQNKGPRKISAIARYSKHVNDTSHQMNSSY
jgi:hypothetical protein